MTGMQLTLILIISCCSKIFVIIFDTFCLLRSQSFFNVMRFNNVQNVHDCAKVTRHQAIDYSFMLMYSFTSKRKFKFAFWLNIKKALKGHPIPFPFIAVSRAGSTSSPVRFFLQAFINSCCTRPTSVWYATSSTEDPPCIYTKIPSMSAKNG